MEPIMILLITAIIIAIILVIFNKQQESKMSNHLYTDDVQQLYQLTTAEYKINAIENQQQLNKVRGNAITAQPDIARELDQLTAAYENGEIPLKELNSRLDYLLNILDINVLDINNASIVQAY
jgi:uncharacterized lipoprotein YehR (DUF1307 family)